MRRLLPILFVLAACTSTPADQPQPALEPHAHSLESYDALLRAIGPAQLVLLGEATHGTHEFYAERARITQQLITQKRFSAVALEAQWADAARVDRYVRGTSTDRSAEEALGGFEDFPRWMWRNREFADLVEWIRTHNAALPADAVKVGVYGLDLYHHEESRPAIQTQLQAVDPAFAAQVRAMNVKQQVDAIQARREKATDKRTLDELFSAEQNARVVRNAEEYDREGRRGVISTWNLRDRHMVETMAALQKYLFKRNGHDHIVVWAHNSHVGDARATGRARYGEWNIGQLTRERWQRGASFTVGFTTHHGTVMAASEWGSEPRVQQLRDSMRGSHGAVFHETGIPSFYLILSEVEARVVRTPRQQRAVGVLYLPMQEATAHYFTANLAEQFDAVIHIDETRAVTPLDPVR
ncbi:MAG TPA: erythromycin esterase family protein [Thermoanaerobaculia bacterium]|nr:erythromycin esterase family protein [Thermoanaerobaculia bacterium]